MLEYTARITSQEPVTEDLQRKLTESLDLANLGLSRIKKLANHLETSNQDIDTAFEYLQSISNQITSSRSFSISTTGYITSNGESQCPIVSKYNKVLPSPCRPPKEQPQIRITLHSDFDQLKRQVATLTSELNKLKAETRITPITNFDLRKRGSTLYPQYGDWLLTSDASEQYLSFSGLRAEIGRSIYIQTRKKVYFYCNNQSFYGLPGSSTRENQWLSNNTTYHFVRASSDSWLVTSSSSPYPWT